jgi:hypothetical protein
LNPLTQIKSGRIVQKVWSQHVLCFGQVIFSLGGKTACLSLPLSQISSKFQGSVLFVSQLHPSTQIKLARILQKVWAQHVLCFGLVSFILGGKTARLSEPLSQLNSKFQESILFVSQLNPSTQKNS